MAEKLTKEQADVLASQGKVLVSASAGSGKTFVMIKKIVDLIASGVDVEEILALTFTNKAALNMKEKLKAGLIKYVSQNKDGANVRHVKEQINKVQIADVSTIHSFCAKLIRTYFYMLDVDGAFEVLTADSPVASALSKRAINDLFDECYKENSAEFKLLLSCFSYRYTDAVLKEMVINGQAKLRGYANYRQMEEVVDALYTPDGFNAVRGEYNGLIADTCAEFAKIVKKFKGDLYIERNQREYEDALDEVLRILEIVAQGDVFNALPSFPSKPRKKKDDSESDIEQGEAYQSLVGTIKKSLQKLKDDFLGEQEEFTSFLQSGNIAKAFTKLVLRFDDKFAEYKKDDGKLDFADLEHFAIRILENDELREHVCGKYKHVYVDEYQDTNPVQEYIIGLIGGQNSFAVGDEKQAIYGFRGSSPEFFAQKRERYARGEGANYRLSTNFRSAQNVLDFVNKLFVQVMDGRAGGLDYEKGGHAMFGGSKYAMPNGEVYRGEVQVHLFDKKVEKAQAQGVYSVLGDTDLGARHYMGSRAILSVIMDELNGEIYDIEKGEMRPTQAGDICVLTRKKNNARVQDIIRTITDAGYTVDGYGGDNLLERTEVKKMLDVLSYLDNCEQDIPLITALLSPLGNLCEDDLAQIKLPDKNYKTFKACCDEYVNTHGDELAQKLTSFFSRTQKLKERAKILGAGKLIEEILCQTGLDSVYARNGGSRLKSIRALKERAYTPHGESYLNEFLSDIRACNGKIECPEIAVGDNIKVMTMHASKGLEFPVVIIADVAETFVGDHKAKYDCDDKYGFVFDEHIEADKSRRKTLLKRLFALKQEREEIKNEANLYYVACTRAMCRLHVMTSSLPTFAPEEAISAKTYAKMADLSQFGVKEATYASVDNTVDLQRVASSPDEEMVEKIKSTFMATYKYADSVNLPVKTSASAILKDEEQPELYFVPKETTQDEEETGTEIGLAYHAYLENCDFAKTDESDIANSIISMVDKGQLDALSATLLKPEKLRSILLMPAFANLDGARIWREREFICKLPANQIMDATSTDEVLVQGAIDLMAIDKDGVKIIDYKYSKKSDEGLIKTYSRQLSIYKKAVARILKVDENTIRTCIINLYHGRQIDL